MSMRKRGNKADTSFGPELLEAWSCRLIRWGRLWERSRFVGGVVVSLVWSLVLKC